MSHHSWQYQYGEKTVQRMIDKAMENYKAHANDPNQASLHTIAFSLARLEQRSRKIDSTLERIAQALEADLRGEAMTPWQAEEIIHSDWARQWGRAQLNVPEGKAFIIDDCIDMVSDATYDKSNDQWSIMYSLTEDKNIYEIYTVHFRFENGSHLQVLSVEKLEED